MMEQMRNALRKKHGSTVAAWRTAIDPRGTGCVAFGRLVIALEDCAFHGKLKSLWSQMVGDREDAMARFADIDEDAAKTLDSFREQIVAKSGSLLQAWRGGLDVDGTAIVAEADFS